MSEKKTTSRSYMIGIIALMFLLIGYQSALFIHRAAVTSIAATKERPDTVYIIEKHMIPSSSSEARNYRGSKTSVGKTETIREPIREPIREVKRVNSSSSKVADAVRKNIPRERVESFLFDPNTVSIEDLCRLGFSTKQAQSIDNYRKKGGRFRRKSDFAKSYVVSDSIYNRLEPYIDIPLIDLNLADSAAFETLPGIGGWYAAAMVRHRKALGCFSDKRQLMDIKGFNQEKFDALKDLVTVSEANIVPYPLWSLPADSLRTHPYIKSYSIAKAIVLYRNNNPLDRLTVRGLLEAGVINEETAGKLSLCRIR